MFCEGLVIGAILATVHSDIDEFETFTPGIYGRYEMGLVDPTAGVFRNSEGEFSAFAAVTLEDCTGENPLFLTAGLATGYGPPVAPIAVAGVKVFDYGRIGVLPVVEGDSDDFEITGAAVMFGFEVPLQVFE